MVVGDYTLPIGFALSGSHQERHNREVGTNEITWVPGAMVMVRLVDLLKQDLEDLMALYSLLKMLV